jgi:hypothetical protein
MKRTIIAPVRMIAGALAMLVLGAAGASATEPPTRETARFIDEVKKSGYLIQEADVGVYDFDQAYCLGYIWTADWPNPGSPYISLQMPQPPVQTEPNWVANTFRIRQDEAVVVIGIAPPPVAYFSFNVHLFNGTLRADIGPPLGWIPVGDPINSGVVRTAGPTPFNRPFALVITGHKRTQAEVHAMLRAAGLEQAINDQALPPALFRLGLDKNGQQFAFAMRTAVPESRDALNAYLGGLSNSYANRPIRTFRVRPAISGVDQIQPVYPADPLPVPALRVAGTGTTELDLYPAMQLLRQRIIDTNDNYNFTELETSQLFEEPYPGLQRQKGLLILPPGQLGVAGATSDAAYLGTNQFVLPDGAFFVVYGVHHRATGKATYSSVSVYADATATVGLTTIQSPTLQGSARDYINDQPNADMFYAWTFTRANGGGAHVSQLISKNYCQTNFGLDRPVDLNTLRVIVRSYMDPATKTHPATAEMVFERVLMFTLK